MKGKKEIDVEDAKAMQMESYAAEKRILNQPAAESIRLSLSAPLPIVAIDV